MCRAFDLPKISFGNKYDYDKEELVREMIDAPYLLTSYRTKEGESRLVFSDMGEEEFRLFLSQVNRLVPLYQFVKAAIITVDQAREKPIEDQRFMIEAIKYFKLQKTTK